MMKTLRRSISPVAVAGVLALATLVACDEDTIVGLPAGAVEVVLAFDGYPQDTMRIAITDTSAIRLAREFVNTKQGPRMPVGRIVRGRGIDPRYPYHYDPASVHFFESVGLDYVSASPYRIPVARLAAAQAALQVKVGD